MFHTNDEGVSGQCRRTTGTCPYEDNGGHFETQKEAEKAYENKNKTNLLKTLVKKAKKIETIVSSGKLRKTIFKIGVTTGVALSAFTLTGCGNIEDPFDGIEPLAAEAVTPMDHIEEAPSKLQDAIDSGISKLQEQETQDKIKDKFDSLSSSGSGYMDKLTKEAEAYLNGSSDSYSNSNGTSISDGTVFWQGKEITPTQAEVDEAKAILENLVVANKSTKTDYNRKELYGRAFKTGVVGKTERRDVTDGVFKNESPQARAISGSFIDPYSGERIEVSTKVSDDTDVEHIVALKDAYLSETRHVSEKERKELANDPLNLQIVSSSENSSKGPRTIDQWAVPKNPSLAPVYAITQIKVKDKYDLSVSPAEKAAMINILNSASVQ